jgi:hypothetical protein
MSYRQSVPLAMRKRSIVGIASTKLSIPGLNRKRPEQKEVEKSEQRQEVDIVLAPRPHRKRRNECPDPQQIVIDELVPAQVPRQAVFNVNTSIPYL